MSWEAYILMMVQWRQFLKLLSQANCWPSIEGTEVKKVGLDIQWWLLDHISAEQTNKCKGNWSLWLEDSFYIVKICKDSQEVNKYV